MEARINIVETANILAHERLIDLAVHSTGLDRESAEATLYNETESGHEIKVYNDEAQEMFVEYYDFYFKVLSDAETADSITSNSENETDEVLVSNAITAIYSDYNPSFMIACTRNGRYKFKVSELLGYFKKFPAVFQIRQAKTWKHLSVKK